MKNVCVWKLPFYCFRKNKVIRLHIRIIIINNLIFSGSMDYEHWWTDKPTDSLSILYFALIPKRNVFFLFKWIMQKKNAFCYLNNRHKIDAEYNNSEDYSYANDHFVCLSYRSEFIKIIGRSLEAFVDHLSPGPLLGLKVPGVESDRTPLHREVWGV